MRRGKRQALAIGSTILILATIGGIAGGWFVPNQTTVTEIAPGVFFRKAETEPNFIGCNQGWVHFKDFVLVIDANFPNQADEVIQRIRKTTKKPIRYVFDTHYHGDHADGNQKYAAIGASAIASENSRLLFDTKGLAGFEQSKKTNPSVYGKLDYQKPDLYFPQKLVIDDGTQRVELIHFGHAHTAGDAVAWLPKHGLLFTGDACANGAFNYTGDSNTASWIRVLSEMQKLPVKNVCPGHGEMAEADLLEKQKRYFVELRQAVQALIDKGKSLDEVKAQIEIPFYKEWTGVDVKTRGENIEFVYRELTGGGKGK
jgi:glyoxylase-like metal-dependent hydrolase (beta-lactamase superfamily II)